MRRSIRHVKLKHLNQVRRSDGKSYTYYRPKGQKGIKLPDLPHNHPRFLAAYAEAASAIPRTPTVTGSIGSAIVAYKASDTFLTLGKNTRAVRSRTLDQLTEKYGHAKLADLREKHIQADLDQFKGHPYNNRLKVWRHMTKWWSEKKLINQDPAKNIVRKRVEKSDGHLPWLQDDVESFRNHWPIGSLQRLAFELIYWTGARIGDAIRLGERNIDADGWLVFRQEKTGGEVDIPFYCALPSFLTHTQIDLDNLHTAISARSDRHLTFMTTEFGSARSVKGASQWFSKAAKAAGIEAKTAHGLRKTRAIAIVEAGGTHHQVGAWTGHTSLKEIERYAMKYNRRKALSGPEPEQKVPKILTQFQKSR